MGKDDRLYAKLTHDFAQHPKVRPLSDTAFRTYVEMILWCCHYLTDGVVASAIASANWPLDAIDELKQAQMLRWRQNGSTGDYLIHDFCAHQTTRAEVERLRKIRKRAGKAGGLARSKHLASATASATASAKQKLKQNTKQNQARKQNLEDRSTTPYVTPNGVTSGVEGARENAPPPCPKHPWGWDHSEPCRACAALRHWDQTRTDREAEAKHEAATARRAAIDACDHCDQNGMRPAPGGLTRCQHSTAEVSW